MKSTNRHIRLDQTKNYYLKMCLLNCILISIVTLTHSLPLQTAQSTQMTLSSAIEEYPKFHDTLLNPAIVPFVNDWAEDKLNNKLKMLSGSYFEMIKKLNDSNVDGLTTLADFNSAMSAYNQTQIGDFCTKFPGYIPQNQITYPESYKLNKYVAKLCTKLCTDDADLDNIVVQPICRVFAIGYQLSDAKLLVPPSVISVKNATTMQAPESPAMENAKLAVQPITNSKSEATSHNISQGQEGSLSAVQKNVNDADKEVAEETIPKDSIDEFDEKTQRENLSPIAESVAVEAAQKIVKGEGDVKPQIVATSNVKENPTPTSISEGKPAIKSPNPSENPIVQTADEETVESDEELVNNDEDIKGITDDIEDSKFNNKLDNTGNSNENNENIENIDDKMTDPRVSSDKSSAKQSPPNEQLDNEEAKSSADQPPSNEQLHNEEDPFTDDTDSNFFAYFMFLLLVCVIAYVVYHNKSKMLALMLEGRRSSTNGRSGLSRRKHTAAYRKLDSNLEEAITSSANGRSTQVIY